MSTKTFGMKRDGTLVVCRALPENRGKHGCPHGEHQELTQEQLQNGYLQQYNEKALEKHFAEKSVNSTFPHADKNSVQAHGKGKAISIQELEKGSNKIAENMKTEDYEFIQKFYDQYQRALTDAEMIENFKDDPVEKIHVFLQSEDAAATKLREFLGNDVDLKDLSEILVQQVGSMTGARKWTTNNRDSIQRVIMSTLNNDMTKRRYIASVLYFGGRCCYCNRVLSKHPPAYRQASGEHITPVSPELDRDPVGGTRYGNMALACQNCNKDRGNKELYSWIQDTQCIRVKDKARALGRIKAFREFALYEDYSPEENKRIRAGIAHMQDFIRKVRAGDKEVSAAKVARIRKEIGATLYVLAHPEEEN